VTKKQFQKCDGYLLIRISTISKKRQHDQVHNKPLEITWQIPGSLGYLENPITNSIQGFSLPLNVSAIRLPQPLGTTNAKKYL
jgi:hypothetical protein